jgi:hypothetical protein
MFEFGNFGKRILKKIFPSFFITEEEIAATFIVMLNDANKDLSGQQQKLKRDLHYYNKIDKTTNMILARKPIHEKAKTLLKTQQDTFLKIQELFGAGSLLFRIREPKMIYFEEYSRTNDIIKKDRSERLGGSSRRYKNMFLYHLRGVKTKEEARERLMSEKPILSNSPFYSSRFYKSALFTWASDPKTVLERTILMLGVSINRNEDDAGLDSKIKAQIETFDKQVHWREPYFYVNEAYSSHDSIYDGYNSCEDSVSVMDKGFSYNDCMYSYAPGVMWLAGNGMMFESVSIAPDDLMVFGCPWKSFEHLPYLDSPEFLHFMKHDEEFRQMAEKCKKDNYPLLMTKKFYCKLVTWQSISLKEELKEFKRLVDGYNSTHNQAKIDYSEYF